MKWTRTRTTGEHVGVSVVHESGWAIGVRSGWVVTLENVEDLDIEPRHIVAGTDRRLVLGLMRAAAEGDGDWQGGREPLQWRKGGIGQGANALRPWCRRSGHSFAAARSAARV